MSDSNKQLMLELKDVYLSFHSSRKTFDHGVHHVLDGVSMRLYEGETLGVIGRNGVGKTTMMRVMAQILAPNSGTITIAPGKKASLLSLGLGFKPELSGRNNALLAAMIQGGTREQAEQALEEIKGFSDLRDSFEEPVKTYSAGMQARLGFTTALMTNVDILLIDEVLSVGDAIFRAKAMQAMEERITSEQTVVIVSHMADQLKVLCDRVVWLKDGHVELDGEPAEVIAAYQQFVNDAREETIEQHRNKKAEIKA